MTLTGLQAENRKAGYLLAGNERNIHMAGADDLGVDGGKKHMKRKTFDCWICKNDIRAPSPHTASVRFGETIEELNGAQVHQGCKVIHNKAYEDNLPGDSDRIGKLRMCGFRRGQKYSSFMNYPYGCDSPAVNSYRVLMTCASFMTDFKLLWRKGAILSSNHFRGLRPKQEQVYIAEIAGEDARTVQWYAEQAEGTLSQAVIMWAEAHRGSQSVYRHGRDTKQPMFLCTRSYEGHWKGEYRHFNEKRNNALAT